VANILEMVVKGDDQCSKVLEGIQGKIQGMSAGLKKAGIAMTAAGAAIVGTMALSIKSFAEAGDEVQKMALKTGFSTESLSELRYAAELSGTSIEGIDKGVKRMASTLLDAEMGLSTSLDAMDALGLSVDEFKGLSPEEAFNKFMEAIAGIEDPLKRSAIAQDIFGKSGTDLLPMMADGAEGLATMKAEASELGLVFDQEAADKAAGFNDSLTELKGGLEGVKMMIAENVIPILMPLIERVKDIIGRVKAWIDENPELFRVIMIVVGGLGVLMMVLGPLLFILPQLVAGIGMVSAAFTFLAANPIVLIIAAIVALIAIGVLLWKNWDTVKEKAIAIWGAVSDFFKAVWEKIVGFFKEHWDKILLILFPAVGIAVLIARNWDKVVDFFKGMWENIKNIFASGINWIIEKINGLIEKINLVPGINIGTIGHIGEAPGGGMPSMQYGGVMPYTGLAYLHKGETVIPANTTINVPIYLDGDLMTTAVIRRLGDRVRLQGVA